MAAFPNLRFALPAELPALARLLRGDRPAVMEVHHLLGHRHDITRPGRQLGIPNEIHVHDYACIAPASRWSDGKGATAANRTSPACEACVADLGSNIEEDIALAALRARSAADLAGARRVVVPVGRSRRAAGGGISPARNRWSSRTRTMPICRRSRGEPRRPPPCLRRGRDRHREGLRHPAGLRPRRRARRLPLSFTVIGHTQDDARLMATGRVFVTGPYARNTWSS